MIATSTVHAREDSDFAGDVVAEMSYAIPRTMSIVISDEVLQSARLTETEVRQELAVALFQKEKLTLGQASRSAGMSQWQFQHLLANRQIPVHYDVGELETDMQTVNSGLEHFCGSPNRNAPCR